MIQPASRTGDSMPQELEKLLNQAKRVKMSEADAEEQRRSFAYGNTHIENARITRKMVDEEAEATKK